MTQSNDVKASEYVLGMLTPQERSRIESEARADPELAERIAWWTNNFQSLSAGIDEVTPPADLLDNIEKRIDRQDNAGVGASLTIRTSEGTWLEIAPGVRKKHLYFDAGSDSEAYLIEMDPGADFPDHDHAGTEDCMVISGDFSIGTLKLNAGDFHAAFRSSTHAESHSENGCLLFIKAAA